MYTWYNSTIIYTNLQGFIQVSDEMIKAIENLEQGHKEMQQSMASIATQQAVQNEQLSTMNSTLKTMADSHENRIRDAEIKINTHETRWKIAGPVILVIVGAVATALIGSFGTL